MHKNYPEWYYPSVMNLPDQENTYRFMQQRPQLGDRVYIDCMASVSGAVTLGDDVSVWPMTVIRGDVNYITIGSRSNIQDGSILHVTHEGPWQPDGLPLVIGEDVTVGHGAILHACTIGDRCMVGMGALIMDGAVQEADSMIAGGAVVPPGKVVPAGTLWRGNPARYARDLTDNEVSNQAYNAKHYVRLKDLYLKEQG